MHAETILVTGGTGFVGKHLTDHLLRSNQEIHVTAHRSAPKSHQSVVVHSLDLSDRAATQALFARVKPTQVYHLASIAAVGSSYAQAESILTQNIKMHLAVLDALVAEVPEARLLHVSSAEVYGTSKPEELPISEDHPLRPVNPYGVSKAAQDLLTSAYAQSFGLNAVRVRPFNHIGAGQSPDFALPAFAKQLVAIERGAEPILNVGNLHAMRDFTDVSDIVVAYELLMRDGVAGEVYNVGSGIGISMQEVLNQMIAILDVPVDIQVDPDRLRPLDIPVMVANNAKIRSLGWQPVVALEESLRRIIEYWRTQT